ncbi:hypothetical protein CYMTET_23106, partial [Cymbomonas tetramitiformis]
VYTFLEEGQLIDDSANEILVHLMTWNSQLQGWNVLKLSWHRVRHGDFVVDYELTSMRVLYWSVDTPEDAAQLLLNVSWVVFTIGIFLHEMRKLDPSTLRRRYGRYSRYIVNLGCHWSELDKLLATLSATLQLVVVVIFCIYNYLMLYAVDVDADYDVYHNLYAPANFFFSPRNSPDAQESGALSVEGGQGDTQMWALPADNTGLEQYNRKMELILMAGSLYYYTFGLHCVWVGIMIPQMWHLLRRQRQVAVLINAIIGSLFKLLQLLPFYVFLFVFSILYNVMLGSKVEEFSTLLGSINKLSMFAYIKESHFIKRQVLGMWEEDMWEYAAVSIVTTTFTTTFFFVLTQMLFVLVYEALLESWARLMLETNGALPNTVVQDICHVLYTYMQCSMHKRPTPGRLLEAVNNFKVPRKDKFRVTINNLPSNQQPAVERDSMVHVCSATLTERQLAEVFIMRLKDKDKMANMFSKRFNFTNTTEMRAAFSAQRSLRRSVLEINGPQSNAVTPGEVAVEHMSPEMVFARCVAATNDTNANKQKVAKVSMLRSQRQERSHHIDREEVSTHREDHDRAFNARQRKRARLRRRNKALQALASQLEEGAQRLQQRLGQCTNSVGNLHDSTMFYEEMRRMCEWPLEQEWSHSCTLQETPAHSPADSSATSLHGLQEQAEQSIASEIQEELAQMGQLEAVGSHVLQIGPDSK